MGSDVNQSKHQKNSCIIVPLTFLASLWGLGILFSFYLTLFLFFFPLFSLTWCVGFYFIFLQASSKSPTWFNVSLSAFDSLSEARFVRARAVCFTVVVCFQ